MSFRKKIGIIKYILHKDEHRKPLGKLFADLFIWKFIRKGEVYSFYLFLLHQKGNNIDDYLTIKEYSTIHNKFDPAYYRPLLEDKIIFDRYIKSFKIPSPELIGIIEKGDLLWINDGELSTLDRMLDVPMHSFCKLATSWGGKDIYRIDINNKKLSINGQVSSIETLRVQLGKGKYILQKAITQHKKLQQLNPSCVNTIRIYTKREQPAPRYIKSFLRLGVNGSIVDNVSGDNLAIGIKKNHCLAERAYQRLDPPVWLTHHPDSGVSFSDYILPFHEEAIRLCCKAHRYFSDFLIIGWDVAIEENGPIILEGNPAPNLSVIQTLYGGLRSEFASEIGDI